MKVPELCEPRIDESTESLAVFVRHGQTLANAQRRSGSLDSRVQGASLDIDLDATGEVEALASGLMLRRFMGRYSLQIVGVHSSDARRAYRHRRLALTHANIIAPMLQPEKDLREMCKGNLEGMLRSEAYPDKVAVYQSRHAWHFRHGNKKSGGETPCEAATVWLEWFRSQIAQSSSQRDSSRVPARIVFGHNLKTSYGVWRLLHNEPLPSLAEATELYGTENGCGLVLAKQQNTWTALPTRLRPTEEELEEAVASCGR